jgi:hypothetical protein
MSDSGELSQLLEQYRQVVASARNRQSREAWAATRSIVLDKWRGGPRPIVETGRAPVCVWLGSQFLVEMLGTDLSRYYREPNVFPFPFFGNLHQRAEATVAASGNHGKQDAYQSRHSFITYLQNVRPPST